MYKIYKADYKDALPRIPDGSVDLILTDPPYGMDKGHWDKISDYDDFTRRWISAARPKLTDAGQLICWHNDLPKIGHIIDAATAAGLVYRCFGVWYKKQHFSKIWKTAGSKLRSWYNLTEIFLVFENRPPAAKGRKDQTGLQMICSDRRCFGPLKEWYRRELERLGKTTQDVLTAYRERTGRSGAMFRHYFKDSQFLIPTREVFDGVFKPLGFHYAGGFDGLKTDFDRLLADYETMRQEYEEQRPVFMNDGQGLGNVWEDSGCNTGRFHPCEKPQHILRRLIGTHSKPGACVLDLFMGSGSTGLACLELGRSFVGIERDAKYYRTASERLAKAEKTQRSRTA